ncbi:alpha/beta fold hydrolase [Paracoccus sp. 11-3]|uniref:Alpha/beta fold hydrolase n=1 Tax=Paracoccus amoyensis TaxID=2760093 RepID=A0A926GFY1_9RHOB|nr:alpha/beta hydrolase [Paracoccus amoyensis]MBC9247562.1 alpha/beta fold hydrolase [Paracoccus amoyensis]
MLRISMITTASILCMTPYWAGERAGKAANGPVEIAYWVQGPKDGPPLVLVNGQGAATRVGADALVDAFLDRGFRVITFDNRDSGQSSILRSAGAPPAMADIMAALSAGETPPVAYDLSDMADDAIAVLDATRIERAHFLGHSLGGMIVQMIAAEHPDRVLSMISASSTSGEPDLPFGPALAAISEPMPESGITAVGMQGAIYRIFEGDAQYRMSDGEVIARVRADMAADDPNASARQGAAAMASGDRRGLLATVTVPALVLHGSDDPWFTIDHAQSTANALGAPMQVIGGMGHIIADAAAEAVADRVVAFVDSLPAR